MQAIILAAGMGRRLGEKTRENTKCMIRVNGISLIDRMLDSLLPLDLKQVILVVGYKKENLMAHIARKNYPFPIEYIENPHYETTNNIYSLYLAKDQLKEDDTLLMESDLIFEHSILAKLMDHPSPNLALVDKYESWMDGTVITLDEENNITNFVPKSKFRFHDIPYYYKTVNLYKFSREFSNSYYIPFLEAYLNALGKNEYYEQVLRVIALLDEPVIKALPLAGEKWYEIDDIQDIDIAESLFCETESEKLNKLSKRYGGYWRFPKLLDYCYLVNPYFPPKKLMEEIKNNFDTLVKEYPSGQAVNSLLAAKNFGINQEYIAVGNGAAELIKAWTDYVKGKIGVIYPTFEEYPHRIPTEQIVPFRPSNDQLRYSADDLIRYYTEHPVSTLILINPDNPSGNYIPQHELVRLLNWCQTQNIGLLVDESFVDFVDEDESPTLLHNLLLVQYSQLTVMKSISKSYGIPGLRLGVIASSNTGLISFIKKEISIWNINSPAEFYLQIASKYDTDYKRARIHFADERNRFQIQLNQIPFLNPLSSQANYFLCEVLPPYTSRQLCEKLLARHDILIKDCTSKIGWTGKEFIRIAVRNETDNNRLIEALNTLLDNDQYP